MASTHSARQWLEVFKFAVYVTAPIGATVYLGSGAYPYLEEIIANREYIKYPAEGERASPMQIQAAAKQMKQRRQQREEQEQQSD